ncbi:hypothetical protein D3C87_1656020 [compost metagenome]
MVGQYSVDFFRHTAVVRTQARLNMRHRDMQLGGCQGAGQGAVGVAVYQYPVRLFAQHQLLKLFDHTAGVLAVSTAADAQIVIRVGNVQLVEEHIGHISVVVLAGVYQYFAYLRAMFNKSARDDGSLDELWASADDG